MSRHYYLTKNGRLRRQDNTLYFETDEQKRPIPVDDVDSLFLFGGLDLNTKLLNFLAQKKSLCMCSIMTAITPGVTIHESI